MAESARVSQDNGAAIRYLFRRKIEAARSRHGITNCRDQKKKYFVVTQHFSGIETHSASVISKCPREKRNSSFKLIYFDI